jgi:hypothetical protein
MSFMQTNTVTIVNSTRTQPRRSQAEILRRFLVTSAIALGVPAASALPVIAQAADSKPAAVATLCPPCQAG